MVENTFNLCDNAKSQSLHLSGDFSKCCDSGGSNKSGNSSESGESDQSGDPCEYGDQKIYGLYGAECHNF